MMLTNTMTNVIQVEILMEMVDTDFPLYIKYTTRVENHKYRF